MKTMLGLLVLTLPFACLADTVVPIDTVESYVNIRVSPEAGTDVVGRLQKGVPLKLVQSISGWHEVELDDEGTTGFVSADWSTVVPDEPVESEGAEVDEEAVAETVEVQVEAAVTEAVEEVAEETLEEVAEDVVEVRAGVGGGQWGSADG